jgi:hypothetical protein
LIRSRGTVARVAYTKLPPEARGLKRSRGDKKGRTSSLNPTKAEPLESIIWLLADGGHPAYSQDSLIDPKANGCCDDDGGHEDMSAAIVAHGDTAPVLDPTEPVFDLVALAVERGIVGVLDFAVLAWRDAWPMPSLTKAERNRSLS